jgi:hypothetical protein
LSLTISRKIRGALGLLFLLPWLLFERIAEYHNWPKTGYLIGLICGMLTGACFSEKPPKWWQLALIGAFLLAIRIWSMYPIRILVSVR